MKEKITKTAISEPSNEALNSMLKKVNEDFETGKIGKTKLLSWIVMEFYKKHFLKSISRIKKENTDTLTKLKSLVAQIEKSKKEGKEDSLEWKKLKSLV